MHICLFNLPTIAESRKMLKLITTDYPLLALILASNDARFGPAVIHED